MIGGAAKTENRIENQSQECQPQTEARALAERFGDIDGHDDRDNEVHQRDDMLLIHFNKDKTLSEAAFKKLTQAKGKIEFIPGETSGIRFSMEEDQSPLDGLGNFIRDFLA